MAWGYRGMRTEHAGAKNGHGFWGKRAEAKQASKRRRRQRDRKMEATMGTFERGSSLGTTGQFSLKDTP